MKKVFFILSILAVSACNMTPTFTIKGTVSGNDSIKMPEQVIIANNDRAMPFSDTVNIVNGKFKFSGTTDTPSKCYLFFKGYRFSIPFFLDNAKYEINIDMKNPQAAAFTSNNIEHNLLVSITENEKKIGEWLASMNLIGEYHAETTTPERRTEIEQIYEDAQNKINAFSDSLIALNPTSHYALQTIYEKAYNIDFKELEAKYELFKAAPEYAENKHFTLLGEKIETLRLIQVGQPAIDFTLPNPKGEDVTFSTIYPKNKLTMIDFWAGWCGPCRAFNPTLVKIYKKYHKQGFEVVGVSLDRDAESWNQAIKDDKLPWIQTSDLKFWNSEVAKIYCVRYIPQNSFVDQNGNIVARQLTEDEIENFIKDFLK